MAVSISIAITQNSQSTSNNTSNVTATVTAKWTYGSYNVTGNCSGSITIDGTKYEFARIVFNEGKTTSGSEVIMTKTVNVSHNSDGTKSLVVNASFVTGVSSGTVSTKAVKTLTTIARSSTPTVSSSSVDMGAAVTISTNRKSSSFTHDLAYSFAGASYVSIANGVGASYNWTTPDLASKIPSATSGTLTIRCITKNGSTTIGTKTVTMTLKVPASVVPSVSAVAVVETVSGLAAQFGAFVKDKSKVKATITAAGAKGSTIKSYSSTLQGKTYSGSSWTSDLLTSSGSLSIVTTVTDTRGRTAKKTTTISVQNYTAPAINTLHVYRVNAAGVENQDGQYIAIRYKYSVASVGNKNTARMAIEYKQSTATQWATLLTGTALSADTTAKPASPTFSTDYQYDIRLTLSDYFGAAAPYTAQLRSGAVILDIGADGNSIGIGETAQYPETAGFAWALKTKHGEIPRSAKAIPAGDNLDSYTTPGYYTFSSAASATIVNLPNGGTGSGSVQVIPEGDANQVRQVVTRCSAASREIWERLYYSNTWQPFQCIYKGGTSRILWTGGMYMTAGHTAPLDEPISKQPTGIVLVFSEYVDGAVSDQSFHHRPILKEVVAAHPGKAECIQLSTSNLAFFATKYLYIHDDKITGHDNNNKTGTGACGITYTNNRFVLRYIIGF